MKELTTPEKELALYAAARWGKSPGQLYMRQEAGAVIWKNHQLEWHDPKRNVDDPITKGYCLKYG